MPTWEDFHLDGRETFQKFRTAGIRVAGYVTAAARYCALTGGRYSISTHGGAVDEQGTCTLPNGRTCDADACCGEACNSTYGHCGRQCQSNAPPLPRYTDNADSDL